MGKRPIIRRLILIGAAVLLFFYRDAFLSIPLNWRMTRLQAPSSPDDAHGAELWRFDHFVDRNYLVYVNGRRAYVSPDFSPRQDIAFREALTWDRSGRRVVLEIAGHRIFGYDAAARRRLTTAELLDTQLPAEPPLWDYGFESEWPGIGHVRRPKIQNGPMPAPATVSDEAADPA